MKKQSLVMIFAGEAVLLAALVLLTKRFPALFSSLAAFPFEQIAGGLGLLSETGRWGNGLAAALWAGISAIPAWLALRCRRDKETLPERISLFVLSGVLLLALYGMANPRTFCPTALAGSDGYDTAVKMVLGISVWAVAVLYVILRLVRLFRRGNKKRLLGYMRTVLYALSAVFAAAAVISLTEGIVTLAGPSQTGADKAFGVFRLAADLAPYLVDIAVILRALELLGAAMGEEQDGVAEAAEKVSRACCMALGLTAAVTAASNIIQMAAMRRLSNVSAAVDIPIVSIAFVLMILLLSRLLTENKRLRDDNDLFI